MGNRGSSCCNSGCDETETTPSAVSTPVSRARSAFADLGRLDDEIRQRQQDDPNRTTTDVFQEAVKKYYELKLTYLNPLIWNDSFTLTLSDIFTQLELVPTREKRVKIPDEDPSSRHRRMLNTLDDLFNPDVPEQSTAPRCILIEGEAGGGKTTFMSKEALDAVSKKTELGKRHEFFLLIRLRDIIEEETIEEMVLDQCVPRTKVLDKDSVGEILEKNQSRVLFLLDGYDELRPEARAAGQAIPELLSGKLYPYSTIVITSRPSAGVQQYTRPDFHVHIMGFSEEQVEEYVQQYFRIMRNPQLAGRLVTTLNKSWHVTDLIHTPIFLLLVCVMWEENQEMTSTGTMTGLYNNLLTCLVRKHCKREGVDMPSYGLPTDVSQILLQLGKLALDALLRNETLIDLAQSESDTFNWELLVKLGVVSLEVSASKWHPRKQLNFSHKTMQEFLAGRYVAHVVGNQSRGDIAELLQLTSIRKAHELSNLLQFTCGCDSRAAQAVMEEVGNLSRKEFSHLSPSDFQKSHIPVKSDTQKSAENYEEFVLLCLDILNERKEPDVLQAVSKALPVIIMDFWAHSKQNAALKYYLQNISSSHLHDKVAISLINKDGLQYLQQLFASPILGLQVNLKLGYNVKLDTPDQTTRLVSVLMNVPGMRALDLSQLGLTPSSLQVLVEGFSHIPLLEELDLTSNYNLGDAGMEVLQSGLSSVPRLTVLRLESVGMTAMGMKSMPPYMRHLERLKELDIRGNEICDTGLESLISVLSVFTAMQVLVLAETGISTTGMHTLVPALCQLSILIKLDIGNNDIGDPGLECLVDILPRLTAMKVLLLYTTDISDRGISSLIKALPHLVQLQVLDVSRNEIGDSGIVSLVETLCQLSSSDMKQTPPDDKSLTTAPHCNITPQELHIGWNDGVTGAGLGRVAQIIRALPALTRLDMSARPSTHAHLSDTAAMALAEALPRLAGLEELDLQFISMEPAGFQAVVQAAEEHPTLEDLWFSREGVPEGADTSTHLPKRRAYTRTITMAEGRHDSATGTRKRKRKTEDDCPIPVEKRANLKDKGSTEEELKTPQASSSQQEREMTGKDQPPIKKRPHREEEGLSTEGVRKYFFFIKENVSSDWKDLAFYLGFVRADTDNIASRNRDDKSCCMDLLEEWLKLNGERATKKVLLKALSAAELQNTADGLKTKYPELKTAQASSRQEKKVFQKAVKKYYELKLIYFKPLIWNDNFKLTFSDIFTQLELMPKDRKQFEEPKENPSTQLESIKTGEQQLNMPEEMLLSEERTKLKSLDDFFCQDVRGKSKAPRCILIEGEAGGGKTTFLSKEALDAVSQKTELGRQHDIILLIRLREVREGETIEEMVWDQCVPETTEGVNAPSIRAILQRNESRVLFLLDGYDELRPEARAVGQAIPRLLGGKLYPNSTVVITSRPSAGVQQYTRPDCHVHIMGFSKEHIEKYVQQYFRITRNPQLAEGLIITLGESWRVTDLIHTPIFLLLVCVMWEENQEMVSGGTMTGLYNNLLTCLVKKHCKREGIDMPAEGLPTEVAESLLQLGKVALEALLRNETLIDLTQFERENLNSELLVKLGVVSLEVSASKWHPRKQLNFSHRSMQEFLAGRYVAYVLVNQDVVELLQLTSISKACELSNLLQFTCGCDSRAAQAVMEELGKLSSKEFSRVQSSDFQVSHIPVQTDVKKSAENYKQFVSLCIDILNERKEPGVLRAVSRALRVIVMDLDERHKKQKVGLQSYLQYIRSLHLHGNVVLNLCRKVGFQYIQQSFASPIVNVQLDLRLDNVQFATPDQTTMLVSVLKNVPGLRALHLPNANLTPSSIKPLVQGFCHMSLLEELDLTENRELGDDGMKVLQAGLSSVPHLTVLRLGGEHLLGAVSMTAVGMASMAPYMRHLAVLRELDISYNQIGDKGLDSLANVLPTFTAMQVLDLRRTNITTNGMRQLAPVLRKLPALIKLDVSLDRIDDSGLECLADVLPCLPAMKELNLNWTRISDMGVSALVKALPHLVELQVLDVSHNEIGDSGIVSLVQTLCRPSSLDIKQNPPGVKSLTTAPRYNTTLQELYIGMNMGVTGAGLARVAQLISALPALTRLDMSGHYETPAHLPNSTAMHLAKALPRLPILEQLDLRRISMEPAWFQDVVQAAEEHPTLEKLWFSMSRVPEGADTSASCLKLSSL
ncbi:uncharacterized protein LOC144872291 [Branchiostoma floridae x Branchiostoma japonicum]